MLLDAFYFPENWHLATRAGLGDGVKRNDISNNYVIAEKM